MTIPRKLTQNFVETEVDGEVLLVDLDGGELFSLSGTARAIWRAIDGRSDTEAIAVRLALVFDGDIGTIVADCRALVGELVSARLVAAD